MARARRLGTAVSVAALAGAVGVFLLLVYVPAKDEGARLRAEIAAQEARLAAVPSEVARLSALNRRIAETAAYVEGMGRAVPESIDVQVLVREISRTAGATGVRIIRIEPGEPVPGRSAERFPFHLTFSGPFEGVFELLCSIEGMAPVTWTEQCELEKAGGGEVTGQLTFTVFARGPETGDWAEFAGFSESGESSGSARADTQDAAR